MQILTFCFLLALQTFCLLFKLPYILNLEVFVVYICMILRVLFAESQAL